ncbi:MAG: PucR family transcriptional regulator [Vulcanimicrobiaceae bacterium]
MTPDEPREDVVKALEAAQRLLSLASDQLRRERRDPSIGFWETLLRGGYADATGLREAAQTHGVRLAAEYTCLRLHAEAAIRSRARTAFSGLPHEAVEDDHALLLLLAIDRASDLATIRRTANALLRGVNRDDATLEGGIGTLETPLTLHRSARNAMIALVIGRRVHGPGKITAYGDLGAYPLLYDGADPQSLRAFAAGMLAPIRAYDEKHQTELERTLRVYIESGQNVKTTSEQLFVHRHTVFYRLRQLNEIASLRFEDPQAQLAIRLALAIEMIHHD